LESRVTNAAPYPPETKPKGWRFELDYERIEQSDTWALAHAELRPWLLMLWFTAWKQTPCGSLPNDDALIAARLGMPTQMFIEHRKVLLRGWWQADDGRLYHDTLIERVVDMLDKKEKDRVRKADYRSRKRADSNAVRHLSHGTDVGQEWDKPDLHSCPTGRTTPEPEPEPVLDIHGAEGRGPSAIDNCPHQQIINLYHEVLPTARRVKEWTPARRQALRSRWRENVKRQSLDWWSRFFSYVGQSDFLMGRIHSPGRKPFDLSLDWLIKADNMAKVIEGAYENSDVEVAA